MSYLKYDSTVKVLNGYFCFHTITEFRGINWRQLEENEATGTYSLDQAIFVESSNGTVEVSQINYYGRHSLSKLIFKNNIELITYKKQKLLVCSDNELGAESTWMSVEELTEELKEKPLIRIETKDDTLVLQEIINDYQTDHTYGLTIDSNNSFYIQNDIIVK